MKGDPKEHTVHFPVECPKNCCVAYLMPYANVKINTLYSTLFDTQKSMQFPTLQFLLLIAHHLLYIMDVQHSEEHECYEREEEPYMDQGYGYLVYFPQDQGGG